MRNEGGRNVGRRNLRLFLFFLILRRPVPLHRDRSILRATIHTPQPPPRTTRPYTAPNRTPRARLSLSSPPPSSPSLALMSPPIISIPFRTLPCTSPPPPSDRTGTQDSTTLLFPPISLHSPSPKDDEDDKKDLSEQRPKYVLDRRRYGGLGALVLLNIVCAMNWVLFTAIASQTAGRFRISYTGVNWLANIGE